MPQITLNDVAGGYNLSAINSNFEAIEDHINSNVLHRVNTTGASNTMQVDMDMNGNRIYNLPAPVLPHEPARLVDVITGGGGSSATNLSTTVSATNVTIHSDTGTDAIIPAATGSDAGVMLPAQVTKLSGIATGATANDTDANLKNRSNHTGTQTASTISDFSEAVDDRVASLLVAGTNVTLSYNDVANTLTINSTAAGGGGGDVIGPASSVNNNIVLFDGLTGKLIKDSGKALPTGDVIGTSDSQTLTTKTISLASNTVSGTLAQFNTACSDADFASIAGSETLTNKALTSPTINGGIATALTGLAVRNAGTGAFDCTLAHNGTLTAGRSLTWNLNDAARTISLSGNLTLANNLTTSGNFALTLTTTASTNVTFPTTGTLATRAGTETFTNKRINPRVTSETSSATPTINTDNSDVHRITAQAVDITSFTTNLAGTPVHGQGLLIEITGTAARAITWGASFESSTVTLPTTTVTTAMLSVAFTWNSATSKWRCIGVA